MGETRHLVFLLKHLMEAVSVCGSTLNRSAEDDGGIQATSVISSTSRLLLI